MSLLGMIGRAAAGAVVTGDNEKQNLAVGEVWITDYRDLMRELRKVDSAYASRLKRQFKRVGKPIEKGIKGTIPKKPPTSGIHKLDPKRNVSGFAPKVVPGRLSWGGNIQNGGIAANHTEIQATKQKDWRKAGRFGQLSITRVAVDNAATVMADMAGRSKKWINKKSVTRPYLYSRSVSSTGKYGTQQQLIRMRQHRINNQGIGMIKALDRGRNVQQGKASRWIWPTAERYLPQTKIEIQRLLDEANKYLNERLKTR